MPKDYDRIKKALKTMIEAPESVKRAESNYRNKLRDIDAMSRDISPNEKDRRTKVARDDRDVIIGRMMEQMNGALNTLADNNDYSNEQFDFSDPKFQAALNYMQLMGEEMPPNEQINMLEQFRGNPGALHALGAAMKKKGLYFADRATEMCKPIPDEALRDAAVFIGTYNYDGSIDTSRIDYSKGEFKKMAARMGYGELADNPDPYLSALMEARDSIKDPDDANDIMGKAKALAQRVKLDTAIKELKAAQSAGENVEDVFAHAVRDLNTAPVDIDAVANIDPDAAAFIKASREM